MLSELTRRLLAARPFVPFTLHFADGHHIEIQSPEMVQWQDDGLLIVVVAMKPFVGSLTATDFAHYIHPTAITRVVSTAIPVALFPPEPGPQVSEPDPEPMVKERVLFVCTHNGARSQMAEALLRHLAGDRFDAASAGLKLGSLHPLAVKVMAEIGLDISHARSKTVFDLYKAGTLFTHIISVCDDSREKCPIFPGVRTTLHWSIADPASEAAPEIMLRQFRAAREALAARVQAWSQQA